MVADICAALPAIPVTQKECISQILKPRRTIHEDDSAEAKECDAGCGLKEKLKMHLKDSLNNFYSSSRHPR